MTAGGQDIDKRLARVALLVQRLEVHFFRDARVQRGVDAAHDRREMRHEGETDLAPRRLRESLPDLRPMAMPADVVGAEVVRHLGIAEMQLGLAPGAAPAG